MGRVLNSDGGRQSMAAKDFCSVLIVRVTTGPADTRETGKCRMKSGVVLRSQSEQSTREHGTATNSKKESYIKGNKILESTRYIWCSNSSGGLTGHSGFNTLQKHISNSFFSSYYSVGTENDPSCHLQALTQGSNG